jgi:hypothetical protein
VRFIKLAGLVGRASGKNYLRACAEVFKNERDFHFGIIGKKPEPPTKGSPGFLEGKLKE